MAKHSYDKDFKEGVIQYVLDHPDESYVSISKRFGVHDTTIGVIICKKENKYIIEYCSDERIFAREYELV